MLLPFLSTRVFIPINFATIKVNIYEHTHVISEMENEGIQQTFQLPSKYEQRNLFSFLNLGFCLNMLTRYNETFFQNVFKVTYFDPSQCNQCFLSIITHGMLWEFVSVIRSTLISLSGDIQNTEPPAVPRGCLGSTDTGVRTEMVCPELSISPDPPSRTGAAVEAWATR